MRKKLKVVILLLIGFIFSNPGFSQTWEEFLISHYWQLQNPPKGYINEKLMFFADGEVSEEYWNLSTNQITNQKGRYSLKGSLISLNVTGEQMEFRLVYISDDKVKFRNEGLELIYAVVNSPSDRFMSNFLNSINGGYNYYTPPANNPSPSSSYKVCYTCNGMRSCPVCKGARFTTDGFGLGTRSKCSACNGTGKCWHCNGTGKQ